MLRFGSLRTQHRLESRPARGFEGFQAGGDARGRPASFTRERHLESVSSR